uniref:DNA-directed DNA polymerase n=1 Tax=Eubacterium plexicaudatum ASF492 TaxID=1235802 RepID=N2AYK3_9FIRM
MKSIGVDLETFSSVDLSKCGVYRYASSPDFEILLFGFSVDGGDVQVVDLACGEEIPADIVEALSDDSVIKWSYNNNFERVCLSNYFGTWFEPGSWRCTMVWAAYLGLPRSLEDVGAVLGLEKQKLSEGKELIRYFCVPCKPTKANGGRTRNLPEHDREKWERFKAYNLRDVEAEMQIQQRLAKFPVPEFVWEEYRQDQEINDRGIGVDMEMVTQAIAMDGRSKSELSAAMQELTELENPNSVQQMKQWLSENGIETDSLDKKAVAGLLKKVPEPLKTVLTLRQQLAKSSVKKYQAMENAVCADSRAHGMFAFYGANRTGRFSGRIIQLQNLYKNTMPDLAQARELVRCGDFEALEILYDSVPEVLSELIRTAFVPQDGRKFIVADFSAIEARVIAWIAGERWRIKVFEGGGDIYCASASQMFHVPVEKHGVNGHLRQKGKQAELACIAEGQPVLTDKGLIPIEAVTREHRLWDGENWVSHEGVVFRGEREVIEYEGLRATPDHLVWIEGQPEPVQFGIAASCGVHLIQTGDGGRAVRMGEDHQCGKTLEQGDEPLLCINKMHGVRGSAVAVPYKSPQRKIKGMPKLFTAEADTFVAGPTADSGKTEVRESKRSRIPQLRRPGDKIHVPKRERGGALFDKDVRAAKEGTGNRPHQQRQGLCSWESSVCHTFREQQQQTLHGSQPFLTGILALCKKRGDPQTLPGTDQGRNHSGCGNGSVRKTEKLAYHQCKARLYDIRNAGKHHRFTVSGKLVHNCGYGGAVGALKAMGALGAGMTEDELQPLVDSWRASNPNIVSFWWAVDRAVKECIKKRIPTETHGIRFSYESGMLFITLFSGRRLAYVKPRIGENRFGGESVTYMGVGGTKKWERLESYGPKFVENIVQAVSRDILCYAMQTLKNCAIVAHVHDEIIIEADRRMSLPAVCEQMGRTPPWAKGLLLRADGYECDFYQKD